LRSDYLKARAVSAAVWSLVGQAANQGIRFGVFVVLARSLDPKHFGVFALAALFIDYASIVSSAGLAEAVVQTREVDDELLDTIFWALLLLTAIIAAVTAALSPLFAWFAGVPEAQPLIVALAATMLFNPLASVHSMLGARNFQNRSLTIRGIIASTCGGITAVVAAWRGLGVWSLVAQSFVSGLLGVVLTWAMFSWRPGSRFSRLRLRSLWHFSGHMLLSRILQVSIIRVQEVIAARFLGAAALGEFRVGGRVLELLNSSFIGPLAGSAFPVLSRVQDDAERFAGAYCRMIALCGIFAIPAAFGFGAIAQDAVPLLFGAKWAQSIGVVQTLSLLAPAQVLAWFYAPTLAARGRPDAMSKTAVVQLVGTVLFSAVAVWFGIVALAAAYVARSYLTLPIQLRLFSNATGIGRRRILATILPPIWASIWMIAGIALASKLLAHWTPWSRLAVTAPLGGLIYFATLAGFFPRFLRQHVWELVTHRLPFGQRYASVAE
jgi:O-antigen/teichoic acid export membrane protein